MFLFGLIILKAVEEFSISYFSSVMRKSNSDKLIQDREDKHLCKRWKEELRTIQQICFLTIFDVANTINHLKLNVLFRLS